jgi:hypothetical protein
VGVPPKYTIVENKAIRVQAAEEQSRALDRQCGLVRLCHTRRNLRYCYVSLQDSGDNGV